MSESLVSVSSFATAMINKELRREHIPVLASQGEDDRQDILQEVCLQMLVDGHDVHRAIRRAVRSWKATSRVVRVPAGRSIGFHVGALPDGGIVSRELDPSDQAVLNEATRKFFD